MKKVETMKKFVLAQMKTIEGFSNEMKELEYVKGMKLAYNSCLKMVELLEDLKEYLG